MWFRRDLRLGDLPALLAAGADGNDVVPVFVVDPMFATSGAPRLAYLHDVLTALDASIRERSGGHLLIAHGDPVTVIPSLAARLDAARVFVSRDYSPYGRRRDTAVVEALRADGRSLQGVGSPYAVDPGSVVKGDGTPYKVFTPFSKVWRTVGWVAPYDDPDNIRWTPASVIAGVTEPIFDRPDPGIDLPPAGEAEAHQRLAGFLESAAAADGTMRSGVEAYNDARDRPAIPGTSQLSPDLKWGAIHPRTVLSNLDLSGAKDDGPMVFSSELAWRDFYADVLFVQPRTAWKNLNSKYDAMQVDTDAAARTKFDRWCAGQTGFGMVDAGMRQLAATGWMHNRVRMIVASFLVKDLHLPWQWGAQWFMQHLIDGDIASNNHGWQWVAGTGTDASPYYRVFNPSTQESRYDSRGEYVQKWAPDSLPQMVDHGAEREEALRRLKAMK
ncbi:MAG: deoxyribodipyrimidine photo-lyase [Ilumatobacter sp.]|jgi:deoxyribodipyrimidine photo-lyase